uniref:C2H2-type domain-containing protein n=1 Tax=Riboviria sp. TaxID=2585031 RepID=A0A8K1U2M5_9VIRU|nr:MAG: hypothetical protein 2 [Riboviria sp.]
MDGIFEDRIVPSPVYVYVPVPPTQPLVAQATQASKGVAGSLVREMVDVMAERPRLTATIAGTAVTYLVYRALKRPLQKKWRDFKHYVHGTVPFEGESMQDGSELNESGIADSPPQQVNLYAKGLFSTSFLGCGARLQTYLVTPYHVVRGCDTIIAENPANGFRMEIPARAIRSRAIADLCYFQCPDSWWSQMGVKSSPSKTLPEALAMKSTPATIVSRNSSSVGSVQPLPTCLYKVSFTGSTVVGFSGALYVAQGRVLGMHQGSLGNKNVGFLWEAVVADVQCLFNDPLNCYPIDEEEGGKRSKRKPTLKGRRDAGTGVYPLGEDGKALASSPKKTAWGYGDMRSAIRSSYQLGDDDWTQDVEVDYDADLEFESRHAGLLNDICENMEVFSVAHLEVLKAKIEAEVLKKNALVGQGGDGEVVENSPTIYGQAINVAKQTALVLIDERCRPIEARLDAVEKQLSQQAVPQPTGVAAEPQPSTSGLAPKPAFPCDVCNRQFTTHMGKMMHAYNKHAEYRAEGRKPAPFLGGKKQPSSWRNSQTNFNSAGRVTRSTPPPKSPENSQDIAKKFENTLEKILEAINGLKMESKPSLKA